MSRNAIAARITKEYHRIEKGLALPEPKPGFAQPVIDWLLAEVPAYERGGRDYISDGARAAVGDWVGFHDRIGAAVRPEIRSFAQGSDNFEGGVKTLTRDEILAAAMIDFDRFAKMRHSIRQFTGAPVPEAAIARAVETALKTPRVCNRESRRVRVAFDPAVRAKMLGYQNGNRGFGHLAGAVAMITVDLAAFTDFGERNQGWIDGGMFAMSLVNALHAQGLGTCMLNSATIGWRDAKMRAALGVPDNEIVITFLAVGQIPDRVAVAVSPAPRAGEVLTVMA
ncbi:nitroreductase family protein [Frigidibacter sp. MR17.14]|uniref:nitroreductase family protein n=1 Tax=Frigidibacter sp. MR17.14 TaxID=3126509 RepID=UPI003012A410